MTPAARVPPARTLGQKTNFRPVPVARRSRRDAALPTCGRSPGGVPLTGLPAPLGKTHVGTRTPGEGRLTSETPQPRTGGSRGRHSRVVGSRRGLGPVSPGRPSVCPSGHRASAPKRLRRGALPSGSARRDPHYCFRRSADGTAFRPAPAACATPSRPRRERRGRRTAPGAPRACPFARGQPPSTHPLPRRAPRARPSPPQRAPRAPPRAAHGPVRPASLQPRQTPATRGWREWAHGERRGLGWGWAGGWERGERRTRTWGEDCSGARSLNHLLSLNSSLRLVDLQKEKS